MSTNNYILNLLNIKDENVYFNENCYKEDIINGIRTKIFYGYLTYILEYCNVCSFINESSNDIIKWDWKRNCVIKMSKVCSYNAILSLDK